MSLAYDTLSDYGAAASSEAMQRIVKAFPAIAYSGPSFVMWAGRKVERRRREGLRNPWAKNIWGIPLDFG